MTGPRSPQGGAPAPAPARELAPAPGPQAMDVVPFNADLEEEARDRWIAGQWEALARLPQAAHDHPDGGRLHALGAAGSLQLGDMRAARRQVQAAIDASCDKRFLQSVLLASARNTLARASMAAGREDQAMRHFERAQFDPRMSSEARRTAQARASQVLEDLRTRRQLEVHKRKAGMTAKARPDSDWLQELRARSLAAEDVHEGIDEALERLRALPDESIRFLMLIGDHFQASADKATAVHYLGVAAETAGDASPAIRAELAQRLVAAGQPGIAMDMLVGEAIAGAGAAVGPALAATWRKTRGAEMARQEHGHELLLAYLNIYLPMLRQTIVGRRLEMVEIGTTRENLPGQGSTRKLSAFCQAHDIRFTTVDMDPHNSRNARLGFEQTHVEHEAVTMKGEDYLRERRQPVDLLFLDAYDFNHGKHSELRQSRYRKFLGAPIDELACHRMHLECAESALRLVPMAGLVCIDDTWLENEAWTAKGTTAMPFLLANGFELVEARNRAALLRRIA